MDTILVPLARPQQAAILSTFILPVARGEHARVILLHICTSFLEHPDGLCADDADDWLQTAAAPFRQANVAVQIERMEAQSIAGGVRAAVHQFKPDLLALSWRRPAPGQPDSDIALHDLLLDVPCDLVVWRGDQAAPPPHRVLIPSAGGPNVELGYRFAADFHHAYGSKILLLTVLAPSATEEEAAAAQAALQARAQDVAQRFQLPESAVQWQIVRAKSPTAGILQMATPLHADVVIIGASREGVLHRIRFGEIPEKVAAQAQAPVLVIKRPLPKRLSLYRRAWDVLQLITPVLTEAEKVDVYREARRSARTTRDFTTMIVLSTAIATFGLMLNAPAVIIGAMLIAPLMSAIIAMGLGIVQGDAKLLTLGSKTTAIGVGLTLLVSFLLALVLPFKSLTPEMLARTSPNLLDLGVALAAGAAGAYALARKNVSSSLPGVAIAVALIPPLATSGMALALGAWPQALGSGLLFLTNLVGIIAMSSWIFLSMDFKPEVRRRERMRLFARGWQAILVMVLLIATPLAVVTDKQLKQQHSKAVIASAVQTVIDDTPGIRLSHWQVEESGDHLTLVLEVEADSMPDAALTQTLQIRLAQALGRPVALTLKVIPTLRLTPIPP